MAESAESTTQTTIEIEDMVTVGTLAERLSIPVARLIGELMKNGVMATVNERIDFDTAQIIVEELELGIELKKKPSTFAGSNNNVVTGDGKGTGKREKPVAGKGAKERPPVIAVMGHVDHGKTSLLDAIRETDLVNDEAGGITQHISAYQIKHKDRPITFLDTPGHEAFAAIREHGAMLTDIVVLVVAADDGVKPQTVEAIRFAKKAGVKIVVAANKTDKEGADINRLKQQLSEHDLLTEEWGGDTIVVPVSAKTKKGIPELLDMLFLVTDVEELKADVDAPARGLIIEAHVEQGRGPVGQALVETGTLKKGDFVVAGGSYAKVRNLETTDGKPLQEATPSMPVAITGFKTLPEFGNEFEAVASEKEARQKAEAAGAKAAAGRMDIGSGELIRMINRNNEIAELKVIVKADVQGSLTSVLDSLKALETDEVSVRVVGSGVGPVGENDLHLAHTSGAIIYGFNVRFARVQPQPGLARQDKRTHVQGHLRTHRRRQRRTYQTAQTQDSRERTGPPAGQGASSRPPRPTSSPAAKSPKASLSAPALARVTRGGDELGEAEVIGLKRGPADAKEVVEGEMCGIALKTDKKILLQEDDRIEVFTREAVGDVNFDTMGLC